MATLQWRHQGTTVDMSFWRKIVNDYREGFHGVISQPKSPKIANFGNPSGNGSK